jgi:hypothetical protein
MKSHAFIQIVNFHKTIIVASMALGAWTSVAHAGDKVDLVSPATCRLSGTHLIRCAAPARTLTAPPIVTAVPMRTTIKTIKTGNCSTQYPVEVTLSTNAEPAVKYRYLRDAQTTVRRLDRGAALNLKIADGSTSTSILSVASDCRVSLDVTFNEVDVNSKAEAKQIIADIEKQLDAKRTEVEWYKQLVQYHSAFLFLRAVADNFHAELTNETVQALRASAEGASSAIALLMGQCGDQNLTSEDSENLVQLLMSLPQLGSPSDWQKPDGSIKTLADFMGDDAATIYQSVEKLALQANPADETDEAALAHAAQDQAVLEDKLKLANQQLASWLK